MAVVGFQNPGDSFGRSHSPPPPLLTRSSAHSSSPSSTSPSFSSAYTPSATAPAASAASRTKELAPYLQDRCHECMMRLVGLLASRLGDLQKQQQAEEASRGTGENGEVEKDCKSEAAAAAPGGVATSDEGLGSNGPDAVNALGGLPAQVAVEQALLIGRLAAAVAQSSSSLAVALGPSSTWSAVAAAAAATGSDGATAAGAEYSPETAAAESAYGVAPGATGAAASEASSRAAYNGDAGRDVARAGEPKLQWPAQEVVANIIAATVAGGGSSGSGSSGALICSPLRFRHNLLHDPALATTTPLKGWEETVVQQEEEEGEAKVEMRMTLPACPSPYVAALLFAASADVHRAGCHSLDRLVLRLFAWQLSDQAFQAYETLTTTQRVSEKGVLQLLFDVRLLADVLSGGADLPLEALRLSSASPPAAAAGGARGGQQQEGQGRGVLLRQWQRGRSESGLCWRSCRMSWTPSTEQPICPSCGRTSSASTCARQCSSVIWPSFTGSTLTLRPATPMLRTPIRLTRHRPFRASHSSL
ncbi:hypothetical protein CLOP_g23807 [Closterium sp. NIES-67]|nr:hypothetical protein CLOP_g23807 [Closterium sp. NIES-67]